MSVAGGGGNSIGTWWNLALTDKEPGVTIDVRPGTKVLSWSLWGTLMCLGFLLFFSLGLG